MYGCIGRDEWRLKTKYSNKKIVKREKKSVWPITGQKKENADKVKTFWTAKRHNNYIVPFVGSTDTKKIVTLHTNWQNNSKTKNRKEKTGAIWRMKETNVKIKKSIKINYPMSNELVTFISLFGCLLVVGAFFGFLYLLFVVLLCFHTCFDLHHVKYITNNNKWNHEKWRTKHRKKQQQIYKIHHGWPVLMLLPPSTAQQVDEIKITHESINCL